MLPGGGGLSSSSAEALAAAKVWRFRARAEVDICARFRQVVKDLRATGAHSIVIEMTQQAAEDEARHAALCTELADEYSGKREPVPEFPLHASPAVRGHGRAQIVMLQLVGISCINETVSASALSEMLPATREGLAHPVIHEILSDEVKHARLGWAHIAHESKSSDLGYVSKFLPMLLDEAVREELFARESKLAGPEGLEAMGALSSERRRGVFIEALQGLVFPGLVQVGVDTASAKAWLAKRMSPGSSPQVGRAQKSTK